MEHAVSQLKLLQKSHCLQITFSNGELVELPCAYLRFRSPAAEQRIDESEIEQLIERNINITSLDLVGNYAVKPTFTDGHNTSIYSWDYLYTIAKQYVDSA